MCPDHVTAHEIISVFVVEVHPVNVRVKANGGELNWRDYLWVPYVIAVFIIVPTAVIALKRSIEWCFKRITGRDKLEAAEREETRRRYLNPDWSFYESHLGRSIPVSIKRVYESPKIAGSPIVRVDSEEFYLYPIYAEGLAVGGFYPLGQNELGEALFLESGPDHEPIPLFVLERNDEKRRISDDVSCFFDKIIEQNGIAT